MTLEQIWAPWRLAYIQGNKEREDEPRQPLALLPGADPACFLCRSAVDPNRETNRVVQCSANALVVLNRYPYNNGHLLVAPCRHVGRLDELTAGEQVEISQNITKMVGFLEKVIQPQGFNIGLNLGRVAGAGLPGHLHWHIVPRWNGDTNFMPLLANVNIIPQSLDALWEALVGCMEQK